ncbi:MAG: hypothetical protein ACRC2I_08755 [Plesiomonas shigelloides]
MEGDEQQCQQAIDYFTQHHVQVEVLGYVASHA